MPLGVFVCARYTQFMIRFINFCIVAFLALTSVTLATAKNRHINTTKIELCSGSGSVSIALDAQGNSIPVSHICPDCVAGIAAQNLPTEYGPILPALYPTISPIVVTDLTGPINIQTPNLARGPPSLV